MTERAIDAGGMYGFQVQDDLQVTKRSEEPPSPQLQKQLRALEKVASALVELAVSLAGLEHVFIITNAMEGWVQYSAKRFVPGLLPVLGKLASKGNIISARGHWERALPGRYHEWKVRAFLAVREQLRSEVVTNLISLGDSTIEMDAVHVLGREFSRALVKTVKFRELPTPEELVRQLELVLLKLNRIVLNARNLKIGLERRWVQPQAEGIADSSRPVPPPSAPAQPDVSAPVQSSAMGGLAIQEAFAQQAREE